MSQSGATDLDLSSLGDGAQGSVIQGSPLSAGIVAFSSGQLAEFLFVGNQGTIDATDVTNIAQTAAAKIDAAGLGS